MDITVLLWLQELRILLGPVFEMIVSALSDVISGIAIVLPFIAYWCMNKKLGQIMLAVFSGSLFLNQLVKVTMAVNRPWILDSRIQPSAQAKKTATGYSFPSSHTQTAATAYGELAYEYRKKEPKKSILLVLLILLSGFLRMYLGVHTPQDVLVGMALALLMIPMCGFFFRTLDKYDKFEYLFLALFILIQAGCAYYALTKNYSMEYVNGELLVDPQEMLKDYMLSAGLCTGIVTGGILEHRLIRFSTDCSYSVKTARLLSGLAAVGAIYLLTKLSEPVLGTLINAALRGILIGFYTVFLHPLIFTKIEKSRQSS